MDGYRLTVLGVFLIVNKLRMFILIHVGFYTWSPFEHPVNWQCRFSPGPNYTGSLCCVSER